MRWKDEALILSARRHGENSILLVALTKEHGKHAGLVKGGASKKNISIYQPGNIISVEWYARLEEQLGTFKCEPLKALSALLLASPMRLLCLSSLCSMADTVLYEREDVSFLYEQTLEFVELLADAERDVIDWQAKYVEWELSLLAEAGFGLDFTECAATGVNDNLIYVSPKSGRAVSASAGEPYKDRLLALPRFLMERESYTPDVSEIMEGLKLTGYFFSRYVHSDKKSTKIPSARSRLMDSLIKL